MPATDIDAFDAAWRARWPGVAPIGHELRDLAPVNWVRFHSLPEFKRYAENQSERDELISRHLTLLNELSQAADTDGLHVITSTWSRTSQPSDEPSWRRTAFPASEHWQTIPADTDGWKHLRVATTTLDDPHLRTLLLQVADDKAPGVIITPPNAAWLFHPYDGGSDVIAPDVRTRNTLIATHHDWLSPYPSGL